MIEVYYACLQLKDGRIQRIKFKSREAARKYIRDRFDPEIHTSCWTE